jgi:hypothetical protein
MAAIDGVRLKLERAQFHLKNVDDLAGPLEAACREAVVGHPEQDGRQYVYRISEVPPIDPLIGIILGDAVHNLRSSLDHLAWQLVVAYGGTPSDKTAFPILRTAPTADQYGRTRPNTNPGLPVAVRDLLDEVQPYKRRHSAEHELAVLHQLNIIDKHRELLVAVMGATRLGWWGDWEAIAIDVGPFRAGDEVCRVRWGGSANPHGEPNPSIAFAVRFSDAGAGPWRFNFSASELMRRSLRYVEQEILPRFAPLL